MIIEDEELRDIYKTASEEHLQKLEDGLLHLEKHPHDTVFLEDVLREAHTLKGDSRMLGVTDVETLIHQLEETLAAVKKGEFLLSSQICDRLYQGLDAIRKLVHEAVTGEPAGVNVFYVLAQLMGSDETTPSAQNLEISSHTAQPTEESLFPDAIVEESELFNADSLFSNTTTESPELFKVNSLFANTAIESAEVFNVDSLFPDTITETPKVTPSHATSLNGGNPPTGKQSPTEEPLLQEGFPPQASGVGNPPSGLSHRTRVAPHLPIPRHFAQRGKPPHASGSPSPHPTPLHESEGTPARNALPIPPSPAAEVGSPAQAGNYNIDTIRVEPQKLDTLMTQAGELTVTKIRIAHRVAEIEEIVTLWEEWSRDAFVNRLALDDVEQGLHDVHKVHNFHNRAEQRLERLGVLINRLRNTAYEDTARLDIVASELESGIRTLRLLPLSTIFNLFPRMVRDLAKQQSKEVNLVIEGGETRADKRILEEMKDPLMHMLRNAVDHGIETATERESLGKPRAATLRLRGYQTASSIVIEIVDDGRGLNIESIKRTALRRGIRSEEELATMTTAQIQSLIFAPGFSTRTAITEISGRGVGLDVVRANVERLKGNIQVESTLGMGCRFRLQLNTTLATSHVLIVEVNSVSYALPVEFVQTTLLVSKREIFAIEGCQTITLDGQPVSVAWLTDLLELQIQAPASPLAAAESKMLPCIILQIGTERLGLLVDALLDEQDVVLKPQSKLLKRVRNVSGATILGTGEVCMILNPQDLLLSARKRTVSVTSNKSVESVKTKLAILLVEDSITIRTQVKRILEGAGYEVVAAVDGLDGFNKLKTRTFDAVVSDVQMPNLDGLSLATKIRQHKEYCELPIILCTTLASDEDKKRGAEAGANAYLTKGTFDQKLLLDTLRRLV